MSDTSVLDSAPAETSAAPDSSDREAAAFDLPSPETSTTEPQYIDIEDEPEGAAESTEAADASQLESTETEAAEASEPESPFDAELIAAAELHGYKADDLSGFGTPAALQLHLAGLDRQAIAWGKTQLEQQGPQGEAEQRPAEAGQQQTAAQAKAALEKLKIELNPEDYDEGTLKVINSLNDHYHGLAEKQQAELSEMRDFLLAQHEQFSQLTSHAQQAEAVQIERELDTSFDSLSEEYGDVFGKGPIRNLPENSPQRAQRIEICKEMRALELADAHQNRPPMSRSELLKRALASRHPDKIEQSVRNKLTKQVGERRTQTLARPAGKHTKPQTAEEKGLQYLRENLPRLGR